MRMVMRSVASVCMFVCPILVHFCYTGTSSEYLVVVYQGHRVKVKVTAAKRPYDGYECN